MTCKRFVRQGLLYAYNELDATSNRQFQQHLSECRDCQEELSRINAQIQLFSVLSEEAPSPTTVKRVIRQAAKRKSRLQQVATVVRGILFLSPRFRWATLATATILLTVCLSYFLHVQKHQTLVDMNTVSYSWSGDIDRHLAQINFAIAQLQPHPSEDSWSALFPSLKFSDRSLSATERELRSFRSDLNQLSQEINF